jgi:hypothetical protein
MHRVIFFCIAALAVTGCNTSGIHPVSGKVKFTDGPMPTAEVATIRFEPVQGTTKEGQFKPASGRIAPDGSYRLTTLEPDDGAFAGDYKVTFTIRKEYMGQGSLVDSKYTAASTTPLSATVKSGKNSFDFEISKAPGS